MSQSARSDSDSSPEARRGRSILDPFGDFLL
jgi:hypothetical protein